MWQSICNVPLFLIRVHNALWGDITQGTVSIRASGADGIKLQLLHVLRGTDLEKEYLAGKFRTLELQGYVKLVADSPEHMVIHRMTGDGGKRTLVAPLWSADKKAVIDVRLFGPSYD